jgi:hypothetical protein
MGRIRGGDFAAFEELIEIHQRSVIGTVAKMLGNPSDAEDIAQQVFIRVWKSAVRYEPQAKFTTWLFHDPHGTSSSTKSPDVASANRRSRCRSAKRPPTVSSRMSRAARPTRSCSARKWRPRSTGRSRPCPKTAARRRPAALRGDALRGNRRRPLDVGAGGEEFSSSAPALSSRRPSRGISTSDGAYSPMRMRCPSVRITKPSETTAKEESPNSPSWFSATLTKVLPGLTTVVMPLPLWK